MKGKSRYKSEAFKAIHSAVSGMRRAGTIEQITMRDFDGACLTVPALLKPEQIRSIRESQNVSQPVFAKYLNTSESTVEKWEMGAKKPGGMAVKLLTIVQKHGLKMLS